MKSKAVVIKMGTIFKILGVGLAVYLAYLVWDILLIFFVSLILAALIDPFANFLQAKKIPRAIAVIVIYLLLFGILGLAIALLVPVLAEDLPKLVDNLASFWDGLQENVFWQKLIGGIQEVQSALSGYAGGGSGEMATGAGNVEGIFSTITGFFGGIITLMLVLVITFYLVVQDDPLKKITSNFVPTAHVRYAEDLTRRMRNKLGSWIRGQLVLSGIIGILVFIGLTVFGIKYAAVLALIAAILEFIPYVGPIIASVPALFLALSQGGIIKFILVLIMYVVIQQIENHLIVPKVIQKAVGLNPVVSIMSILIGAKLAGVLGALVAIPAATALSVVFYDLVKKQEKK